MYDLKLPGILMHMTNGFREQGGGPELVAHSFTSLTHALLAAVSLVHPYKGKDQNHTNNFYNNIYCFFTNLSKVQKKQTHLFAYTFISVLIIADTRPMAT